MASQESFDVSVSAETVVVPVNDKRLQENIGIMLGLKMAVEAIEDNKVAKGLAGLSVAKLVVSELANKYTRNVIAQTTRLCAKAGVDMAALYIHRFDGITAVVCEPFSEIAGLAEDAE